MTPNLHVKVGAREFPNANHKSQRLGSDWAKLRKLLKMVGILAEIRIARLRNTNLENCYRAEQVSYGVRGKQTRYKRRSRWSHDAFDCKIFVCSEL
jgi:hypothetical protein